MKKGRNFISALLIASLSMSLLACSGKKEEKPKKQLDSAVRDEIRKNAAESELLTGDKLENGVIKWLSDWDINPDGTGKNVPIDLAVFQERYGGEVKFYRCSSYSERYDKLTEYISSGEGIDFFYGGNLDAFPRGAIKKMFVPVDDYIDFDSPLWEDVKDINDSFLWNDKHYMASVQVKGDDVAVVYNRKTVAEAGLEDPADLYARGEWTWDKFREMLESYVDNEKEKYGIDGWWFEFGLMNTTGVPPISLVDGKLVNNLSDPSMERVQNLMYDLCRSGCIAIGEQFAWTEHPEYIGEGKTLFYPVGLYEFYKEKSQWSKTFGSDVFFVPMPRDPEADEYYIPTGLESYLMVSGGSNPEGVAKYLDCKRFTLLDENTKSTADKQFLEDYGWTQDMLDMKDSMQELADANPVVDISKGISKDCGDLLDDNLRLASRGTPWNETYDAIYAVVDKYLENINSDPESADVE